MIRSAYALALAALLATTSGVVHAQQATTTPASPPAATTPPAPAAEAKPEPLVIFFDIGSSAIRAPDLAVLDKASRLYTEANPSVMIVSGSTDTVGTAQSNLELSQRRAAAVLRGLIARGIPAEHFQVLAKGGTEPAVATAKGVDEPRNRRVEIAWR